jgi:hypothetical protein
LIVCLTAVFFAVPFSFDTEGKMTGFTTQDRTRTSFDGKKEKCGWSVRADAYAEQNGFRLPAVLQAVCHISSGDIVYFNADNALFSYGEQGN